MGFIHRCCAAALGGCLLLSMPARAADPNCKNTGSFEPWLDEFRAKAAAEGVSDKTIRSALGGMAFAPDIIARDRKQSFFNQTFLEVVGKLASPNRLASSKSAVAKHAAAFKAAEETYGVPAAVIAAFWALESDFGVGMGNLPVLRSLATLAYDCRRGPELFQGELMAALKIIDRGDLTAGEMIGSWAGELGQTQFLPSHYLNHATDGDGDGDRDLLRSAPDIIHSTAKYINHLGWKRGEPWLEEVRVPAELPWAEADLAIQHQRGKWASLGVTYANGDPLPRDGTPASLLLPMGRFGPAFLAYANFTQVYLQWNQSLNYATTAGYLATRVAGAPPIRKGNGPVATLETSEVKDLQVLLTRQGFDVGRPDGTIGAGTRAAVKAVQKKLGMPEDSYPTPQLLSSLRGGSGASAEAAPVEERPRRVEASAPKRKRPPPPSDGGLGLPW